MRLARSLMGRLLGCVLAGSLTVALAAGPPTLRGEGSRVIEATATVVRINRSTRQIVVRTPEGDEIKLRVDPAVGRFEEIRKGDVINATYRAAFVGELRQPTPEERAEPWLELNAAQKSDLDLPPAAKATQVIRAVCEIIAVNRKLYSVTVRDPHKRLRVIENIDPEDLAPVQVGDEVVFTFTQSVAMALEPAER